MHELFMRRAIDLSRRALDEPGTEPFGAVIVKDGVIVGEGLNHAAARSDPTSHGEIEAIRDACKRLKCIDLSECDLYTSCEPCALCVAAIYIAGIQTLYYAATLGQSDRALGDIGADGQPSMDGESLREQVGLPLSQRAMRSAQLLDSDAVAVLKTWAAARAQGG
jgi:guanine deaminase